MNRLQLVQRLRRETGVGGGNSTSETPTSTLNQTGEYGQLVDRIDEAWTLLQQSFKWEWLWEDTTVSIAVGQYKVTGSIPAQRYLQNKGRDPSGAKLQFYPWDVFDDKYPVAQISDGDAPFAWTVAPDKSVRINTKPITVPYVLGVQRYKNPIAMTADTDLPGQTGGAGTQSLDAEHHMLIVWKAAMLHFKHEVAGAEYRAAKDSYDEKLMELGLVETPQWSFGTPLLVS